MKILFIFDRVMHYHVDLFQTLERELEIRGHQLFLLSGKSKLKEKGRVGLDRKIIKNEIKYNFSEINIFSYKIRYQKGIIKYIKEIKPDVIVIAPHVGNFTIWLLGILRKKHRYMLFSWQCGYEYHENIIKEGITKLFLRLFDHHLAYHTNAQKYLIKHKLAANKISIIFNTINESKIKITEKKHAREIINNYHNNIEDKFIVLFVGAILKEKNLDYLIESYKELNRKDVILIIVGDGEYLDELKNKHGEAGIIYTGKIINGVDIYFDAADVFVLPGTGGLAINEAMAHSLPIISSYADGSADDLVIPNVNGFRLQGSDKKELIKYLEKLLTNTKLRKDMGERSREMITNKYSFANFISRILNAIITL